VEVLLLSDRVDEWLMSHLGEYDGKALRIVRRENGRMPALTRKLKRRLEEAEKASESLIERMQGVLSGRVAGIRPTVRLTSSPACLTVAEHEMGAQMRRIMEAAGQEMPETKPTMEINVEHPLLKRLDQEADEDRFC
jgi:molecular chaperone HtpG